MSLKCCSCPDKGGSGGHKQALPLLCLVPKDSAARPGHSHHGGGHHHHSGPSGSTNSDNFQFLDNNYLKKHFNLPPRALYLDPFRRPLITFPISGENTTNFTIHRKAKTNQMILDGLLDPSEALIAPSVFPYAKSEHQKRKEAEADEEIIYILQLPDWEFKCPVHNQTIRTPRFIWHSCKKEKKKEGEVKQGPGPLHKPKPWLLSRHTDFDYYSQW